VPQPFDGIRVLDFTQGMPGSVTTMVMSDFGAEVIKVERPGGDPFRSLPASLQWDRGKKSVVLDLKTEEGRRNAQRLSRGADVVIESFRPGVVERLGIDHDALGLGRPDLIYCSITGWGPQGPYAGYKAYDAMVQAKAGRMLFYAGQTRREGPHYTAVAVASHAAGMAALRGVTAALMVRDTTGQGQKVETSLLQGLSYYDWVQWMTWQMMQLDPDHYPEDNMLDLGRTPAMAYVPARTKDGKWIQLANHMVRLFQTQMRTIGLGNLLDEPRFAGLPRITGEPQLEMWQLILERMQGKTLYEWMDIFVNKAPDVAAEPYMTAQEGMSHPQVLHNGHVVEVDDPRVGPMRQLGPLFDMSETPGSIKGPAPDLGQHTEEVLAAAGNWTQRPAAPAVNRRAFLPGGPLEGVTVLDFTTVIAGPLAGSLLAELGARVIRVEAPQGDHIRHLSHGGIGANRTMAGTQGLCLDLKTPEGREIVHALVKRADVLMHNMRPGAPERIGIGYEQVRELNPTIVYQYIAGYGSTGPHSERPAMYPVGGCISGGALAQAGRGMPPSPDTPMTIEEIKEVSRLLGRAQEVNPDLSTGMVSATSVVMALYARERFGVAQYLEPTLIAASAYACVDDFYDYAGRPERPLADPDGYGLNALYRLYRAENSWLFLACPMPGDWETLCDALDRGDLAQDARFVTPEARRENDEALAEVLGHLFVTRPAEDWEREMSGAGVGCVQAQDRSMYHFFLDDPHVRANGFTTELDHVRFGRYWRHSPGLALSKTPCTVGPGPLKGQHTAAILREIGYSEGEIAELHAAGVVDWETP
jgi:crotonobetainyl-CoA:carnitine CoA-transferase CaiB-like acyl-CoA transferase